MGAVNPERVAGRRGQPTDPLRRFTRGWELTARCRRVGCAHQRSLIVSLLIKAFGANSTLSDVAQRLRCSKCGMRGARIQARYLGRHGDGR